jgi:hypothetical protein
LPDEEAEVAGSSSCHPSENDGSLVLCSPILVQPAESMPSNPTYANDLKREKYHEQIMFGVEGFTLRTVRRT